jgi:hypothetical protein
MAMAIAMVMAIFLLLQLSVLPNLHHLQGQPKNTNHRVMLDLLRNPTQMLLLMLLTPLVKLVV